MKKFIQYQDAIAHMYMKDVKLEEHESLTRNVTFQVTDDCTAKCTYCYQGHKGHRMMSKDVAKRGVDLLFKMWDENKGTFINQKTKAIILEFIGGEPLMNIDIIDYICSYFVDQCIKRHHPWLYTWRASMISNGSLYFDPKVQSFLEKFKGFVSFGITLDGPKEVHDACRVYPDGRGNFDDAYAALKHFNSHYYEELGTKCTIAPENLHNMNKIVEFFINEGMTEINANCVYEAEWTDEQAQFFYQELKKMTDYILSLKEEPYVSLFQDHIGRPMPETENQNWCWAKDTPILTTEGYKPIQEIKIGDMVYTEDGTIHPVVNTMSHIADNIGKISGSGIFDMYCTADHKLFAKPFSHKGNKNVNRYKEYGTYEVQNLKQKDLILMGALPEGTVNFNKQLAYIVGRYIGDSRDYQDEKDYTICCSFEESPELEQFFVDAQVDYHKNVNTTIDQYVITKDTENSLNKKLYHIFKQCGHLAHNKHFPSECFNWNKASLEALLKGYLDANGSVRKVLNQHRIGTISAQLAEDLMLILRSLGKTPICCLNKRGGKNQAQKSEANTKDRYEVYFYDDIERTKFVKNIDNKIWLKNFSFTPIKETMEVYNITVADNHSYIAGGLMSSNCGGTMAMLVFDPDGRASPCLRYLESSLGEEQPPIIIGSVDGLFVSEEQKEQAHCLECITRRSQSTDECFYCPIASGCAWCSAWNYQSFGTADKRSTNICVMHKSRVLANVYYWNKYYRKHNMPNRFECHLPKEEALRFISEEEYNYLIQLSQKD